MGRKLFWKWSLLILAFAVCGGHPIIQEVEEDVIIPTASISFISEADGPTEPSQSPPPDLEALQAEARYDASAMLRQPSATSTRHADSCEAEGRSYKHGDKIWRPDPCETCLCLDGETFCWWQQCEMNQIPDEPPNAFIKDIRINEKNSQITDKNDENTVSIPGETSVTPNLSRDNDKGEVSSQEELLSTQNTLTSDHDNIMSNFSTFTESDNSIRKPTTNDDKQTTNIDKEITNVEVLFTINNSNYSDSTNSQKSTDLEEQESTFQQSGETNDASMNLSTESFMSTTNDGSNYTTNDASRSSFPPEEIISTDLHTMETQKQVAVTRMCTVMGVEYAVGAVLPGDTGNCLRCVCTELTPSVSGVTASSDDQVTSPIVTCHPHDCAPLTRKDILEDSLNTF